MKRIRYRRRRPTYGDRITDIIAAAFAVGWLLRLLWRGWRLA
jgi:hypothetical protein